MTIQSEILAKMETMHGLSVDLAKRCVMSRQYPEEFTRLYYYYFNDLRPRMAEAFELYSEICQMQPELYFPDREIKIDEVFVAINVIWNNHCYLQSKYKHYNN